MTSPYDDLNNTQNVATGAAVSAAWFDKTRDNGETLARPPGCIVRRTATQSIPDATLTAISFTATDDRDTDAYHSTSSNQSRMTVPTGMGGWYEIGGSAIFASNGTGNRILQPRVNGSTSLTAITWTGAVASSFVYPVIPILLAAGDYVEMLAYQNSGGALNVTAAQAWLRLVAWS